MSLILLLLFIGILLISCEIFVPGMILGIAGGICLLIGTALTYQSYGIFAASGYLVGSTLLTLIIVFYEFKLLPKTALGKRIFLSSVSGGKSDEAVDEQLKENLVGKEGETLTTLAPSGLVLIEGREYEAYCQDGLLRKGRDVCVSKQDKFRLFVREK